MRRHSAIVRLLFLGIGFRAAFSAVGSADADIRDQPRVQAAVEKALKFLDHPADLRAGAWALAARAQLIADHRDHPCIPHAVEVIRRLIRERPMSESSLVYSLGLSLAFLSEYDAAGHRSEIDGLIKLLLERQTPQGGWGYLGYPTCDTSMTQYAVFGLWSASRAGIDVDESVWIRAANWLLRTQDASGAWGYQGNDPGTFRQIAQRDLRRSMTEAAMATLYLCGEHLRFFRFESDQLRVSRLLKAAGERTLAAPSLGVERRRLEDALRHGARWNDATREPIFDRFPYYHLYTIERLNTFRRAATTDETGIEQWHLDGVEWLLRRQNVDGSWIGDEGAAASTAFAVLFILRATQKSLVKFEGLDAGTVVGGRGLPEPAVGRPQADARPGDPTRRPDAQLAELMRQMDDPKFLASFQGVENLGPSAQKAEPEKLVKRLLEMAGDDNPQAKAAALRALGRTRNFDDLPVMIEAIRDPNPLVHQAAVDALRRFDRRSADYGKPVPADDALRAAEADSWRQWYRTIRPTGR
jgi:hypothetical protein